MLEALTPDTQATLLLVGRFSKSSEVKPLTTVEYNQIAKQLLELGLRPADLLREIPKGLVSDISRLTTLLSRGTSLALAIERWARLGISVIGRADEAYPKLLKSKLRGAAAPILYFAGNVELLNAAAVCVVGSRDVSESGLDFALNLGRRCAVEGLVVVSGEARGVDRAAIDGTLDQGGKAIAVLVDALTKAVLSKRNREAILAQRLTLVTPFDPESGFTVSKAMERNKYMYALASAAVIVESDTKGGTWSGAVENEKYKWTPAFVRVAADAPVGNLRLAELGLQPILPEDSLPSLKTFLSSSRGVSPSQPDFLREEPQHMTPVAPHAEMSLYSHFLAALRNWLAQGPQPDTAIANRLELELVQCRRWLDRAINDGLLERCGRPARYALRAADVSTNDAGRSEKNLDMLL